MSESPSNVRFAVLARLSDGLSLATFKGKGDSKDAVETTKKVLKSGNLKAGPGPWPSTRRV